MDYRELAGEMPLMDIITALDDNRDGEADEAAWERVQGIAGERVANAVGGEVPGAFAQAASYARKLFCLEALYNRRGFSDDRNPFAARAREAEKRLRELASGDNRPDGAGGGECVTTRTRATPRNGGLMA